MKDVKFLFDYFVGMMQSVVTFFYNITAEFGVPNYGVAIILFTVVIKSLLFPLTAKQVKSMKAMKKLGPQMKVVQEKYKDDKIAQQKAMTDLYKETGVNPLAGCLPILLQMPILSGMFYALRNYKYVSHPGFLWIKNLSAVDHFHILPILVVVTTYLLSRQGRLEALSSAAGGEVIGLVMPLFVGYMTWHFPAGLGLYWVVSNLVQMVQQRLLQSKEVAGS